MKEKHALKDTDGHVYRFYRDLFHVGIVFVVLLIWWLVGAGWYFWPLWVFLGIAISFFVRACSSGMTGWGQRLQDHLSRLLGRAEVNQIDRMQTLFEHAHLWLYQKMSAVGTHSVRPSSKTKPKPVTVSSKKPRKKVAKSSKKHKKTIK